MVHLRRGTRQLFATTDGACDDYSAASCAYQIQGETTATAARVVADDQGPWVGYRRRSKRGVWRAGEWVRDDDAEVSNGLQQHVESKGGLYVEGHMRYQMYEYYTARHSNTPTSLDAVDGASEKYGPGHVKL